MGGKIDWLTGCRHRVRYSHFVIKTGICAPIEGLWWTTAEITEQNIRWRKRVQKAFSSCMYNHLRAVELHVWTTFYKWTPQISRFRIENIQNMQITVHIASLTVQIIGRTYSTILQMNAKCGIYLLWAIPAQPSISASDCLLTCRHGKIAPSKHAFQSFNSFLYKSTHNSLLAKLSNY